MKWALLFHLVLACLFSFTQAQKATTTDVNDNSVVVSYVTDNLGDTTATSLLSTIGATTTKSSSASSLSEPTQTGTALPPYSSVPVSSGSIIALSDYTNTGLPSNYPKKNSAHPSAKSFNDLGGFVCSATAILGGLIGAVVLL